MPLTAPDFGDGTHTSILPFFLRHNAEFAGQAATPLGEPDRTFEFGVERVIQLPFIPYYILYGASGETSRSSDYGIWEGHHKAVQSMLGKLENATCIDRAILGLEQTALDISRKVYRVAPPPMVGGNLHEGQVREFAVDLGYSHVHFYPPSASVVSLLSSLVLAGKPESHRFSCPALASCVHPHLSLLGINRH
jgi:hypothetical protein